MSHRSRTRESRTGQRRPTRVGRSTRRFWIWVSLGGFLVVGLAAVVAVEFSQSQRSPSDVPDLPGIDVAGLDPEQLHSLIEKARATQCSCTCGFTLADCRHKDRTCPLSGPILEKMVDKLRNPQRSQ